MKVYAPFLKLRKSIKNMIT